MGVVVMIFVNNQDVVLRKLLLLSAVIFMFGLLQTTVEAVEARVQVV